MTLTFKLFLGLFLILCVGKSLRLHDTIPEIDEASAWQEELGLGGSPYAIEKGLARSTRVLGNGRLLSANSKVFYRKGKSGGHSKLGRLVNLWKNAKRKTLAAPKLTKAAIKSRIRRAAKAIAFWGTKRWKKSQKRMRKALAKLKELKKKKLGLAKPQERRLSDSPYHRLSKIKLDDNAGFLQMLHDRQTRFSKLHIREVAPPKRASPSKKRPQRKLVQKKKKPETQKKDKAKKKTAKKLKEVPPSVKEEPGKLEQKPTAADSKVAPLPAVPAPIPAAVTTPQPLQQVVPLLQTPALIPNPQPGFDRTLEDEERKAQNFVSDLQNQVRQTRIAVENIQDKLILMKENEGEIKSMLNRLLANRNLMR